MIGVTVNGECDISACGSATGSEGAKFGGVLTEMKNRGVADVCVVVCDGLKGLPDAINTVWAFGRRSDLRDSLAPQHFRYASRRYWDQIAEEISPGLHRRHQGRG